MIINADDQDDDLSEAAAARLRGQFELFPLIKAHENGDFSIKTANFRDAIGAVTLRERPDAVPPDELGIVSASEGVFLLEGTENGIRIQSRYQGFHSWASFMTAPGKIGRCQTVSAIISQHFLKGLQNREIRSDAPMRVSFKKGQMTIKWGSAKLFTSTARLPDVGRDDAGLLKRWQVDPRALRRALVHSDMISRATKNSRAPQLREGGLYAGGSDAFLLVRDPGLLGLEFTIAKRDSRRLKRVLARLHPAECFFSENATGFVVDDGLVGCAFDKVNAEGSRVPPLDLPAPYSFAVQASDLALRGPILTSIKPLAVTLSVSPSEAGTAAPMLQVRSERLDRPDFAQSLFPIISDGPVPERSWSFRMRPAIWDYLVELSGRDVGLRFEADQERFLRVGFKDDTLDGTIIIATERLG